jgi:CBS domain-containing protein
MSSRVAAIAAAASGIRTARLVLLHGAPMLDAAATHHFPVCTRLVVVGPYRVQPTSWVPCPRRGGTELSSCLECPRYAGLEPTGRGADVTCHADIERPAADAPATVAHAMTRDVFCVAGDVEIGLVAALLVETGLHAVPVVDEAGCPVGMVSTADLIRAAGRDDTQPSPASHRWLVADRPALTARDAMQRLAVGAHADDSPPAVGARMLAGGVDHLPVVDDEGRLVGVVTAVDLARWSAAHAAR